jgi:lipopolysaccharide/colanic/teichoic acid biosynthesis glycosyltransferase
MQRGGEGGEVKPWYARRYRLLGRVTSQRLKRLMDVGVCLVALPFVLLLLALCCLAIRLDSAGAPLFVQERTGKGGRRFPMYKLRTMVRNAEALKTHYQSLNKLSYPDFKLKEDPRITRVGCFLRKTSLDELPQIFNVLRGDMSLVGPRPTSFDIGKYRLWHTARLQCTPGLTGLWQVSGHHELDFDERVRLDIAYIRHQSLWLDVRILGRTMGCVLGGRGE